MAVCHSNPMRGNIQYVPDICLGVEKLRQQTGMHNLLHCAVTLLGSAATSAENCSLSLNVSFLQDLSLGQAENPFW